MKVREISQCRSCRSESLVPILSLGQQYVSDFVDGMDGVRETVPLELVLCKGLSTSCGLLQLKHTVSAKKLYANYWYKSGVNESMRMALAGIAEKVETVAGLGAGDLVLDIGCNDGTLLRNYRTSDVTLVGFDPARNLATEAKQGTTHIITDFFNSHAFQHHFGNEKARIVTSVAMFYDLDNPNEFVADVAQCLHRNGVWVIEMQYLPDMLEKNAYDQICHEHLEYYCLLSIMPLVERHGLAVVDVELNSVNGGSFRVWVMHKNTSVPVQLGGAADRINNLVEREKNVGLSDTGTYESFAVRVTRGRRKLVDFVCGEVHDGKTVYVYGASTKGNTLLQYCGLDNTLITAAAERNPDKWGKMTVGTRIPIISERKAREERPDYFLILPWHFLDVFVERERKYLESGGQFIVPRPELRVVSDGDNDLGNSARARTWSKA